MPVQAPTFQTSGWDSEVAELLRQIAPTPQSDAAVAKVAAVVKRVISPILPDAEVSGFTNSSLHAGAAFGVAVPDIDIVINIPPEMLMYRLQGRGRQSGTSSNTMDVRKLQKSAIRLCTDRLVGVGSFKFRRSAFRGSEPKVTMIAPSLPGVNFGERGMPINLGINSETPLYNAALVTESGQIDARAQALIVLVKRWAKDRGLCHVSKGHLSPYGWTLLTVYFLQVGTDEVDGPVLPSVENFNTCRSLLCPSGTGGSGTCRDGEKTCDGVAKQAVKSSVGTLFKDFVRFYAARFDWRGEAVSVRGGRRGPPSASAPIHVIHKDDGASSEVAPTIEDPFRAATNLGDCMCEASLAHLRAEFARADRMCSEDDSLTLLLQPWAPAEAEQPEKGDEV